MILTTDLNPWLYHIVLEMNTSSTFPLPVLWYYRSTVLEQARFWLGPNESSKVSRTKEKWLNKFGCNEQTSCNFLENQLQYLLQVCTSFGKSMPEFGHLRRRIARGNPCAGGRLFDNPMMVNLRINGRVWVCPLALALRRPSAASAERKTNQIWVDVWCYDMATDIVCGGGNIPSQKIRLSSFATKLLNTTLPVETRRRAVTAKSKGVFKPPFGVERKHTRDIK